MDSTKRDIAIARRMLQAEFPTEGVTAQLSARIGGESAFWLAGPECPEGARPEDAARVGLDGRLLQAGAEPVSFESLHAAIYRARPEMNAMAFVGAASHAAVATHESPLATYYQYGGLFLNLVSRVMLTCPLDSPEAEAQVVSALGQGRAVFIAGWGAINVSESLRHAAAEAQVLMLSSTRQVRALRIGGEPMSDPVARSYQSNYLKPEVQFRTQMWLAAERRVTASAPAVFGNP